TRFAINQACVRARVPLVSGAAIRAEGQVIVFDPRQPDSPCYRCLYNDLGEEALSCSEAGVLGPLVGMIGATQAMEALKLLAGIGRPLTGRLLLLDAMTMQWREMAVPRDPGCPVCGQRSLKEGF
ncbi:MAG: ThiF family adenylyltransferase, partial [Oleiphilaceae bacterium]|nr:ThiF family adenylyltransferase [Oleiphilaceae bacterium]